ncbi:hypothetical protein Adt_06636 [Abeliophyllum distichum]|uniref:Uncharacterized protein n=1 Tax=Abeliophyllum distichum TaxID=126358 RepID=A0ABD1V9R2_9LAMI
MEQYRGAKSRREMREIVERDVDSNVSDLQIQKWIIAGDRSLGGERLSVFTGAEEAQTCHWANAHCVRGEMNPRFFDTEDGAIPRMERYRGMKSRREMREIEERDVDINVSDPQIQKWIIAGDRSLGGEEFGFRDLGQKSRPQ